MHGMQAQGVIKCSTLPWMPSRVISMGAAATSDNISPISKLPLQHAPCYDTLSKSWYAEQAHGYWGSRVSEQHCPQWFFWSPCWKCWLRPKEREFRPDLMATTTQ